MREFKFRAWDKHDKKMIQPHDGDFIKWHAMSNWKDCLEVMQYTGLKDKNGVEIYEGDILQDGAVITYVHWLGCGWHETIIKSPMKFLSETFSLTNSDDNIVTGNIYEHPHLLEEGAEPCN